MTTNLKVIIIDDHRLFREGLESLLQRRGIDVLAAVGNGNEGIELVEKFSPDIVLLDLRMPVVDGISILKTLKERYPELPAIMLTTSANESDLFDALKAGANGYLLKDMEPDALVTALQDISQDKTIVAPDLASILARYIQGNLTPSKPEEKFYNLTPRETDIIQLLAEGQGNKLIAKNLGISDGTVKLHVKSILRKMEVSSRVEAAVRYIEHNYKKTDL